MNGVKPAVIRCGNVRECRKCGMKLEKHDAIGPYPTEFGEDKGLFYDAGVLRHDCEKNKKGSEK